jgi:hypothetical protein
MGRRGVLLAALGLMFLAVSGRAGTVYDQSFNWVDCVSCGGSGGTISIDVNVSTTADPTQNLWTYTVTNNTFDPDPANGTNGLSGLTLLFPQPIPVNDQNGPAGWALNSQGFAPPDAVGWDQPSGAGIPTGGGTGTFSFETSSSIGVSVVPGVYPFTTSFAYSYDTTGNITGFAGTPVNLFSGDLALPTTPEPASWTVLAIGVAFLIYKRRALRA